jgi:type VI secretion system protein ImpI
MLRIMNVEGLPDGGPVTHVAHGQGFQIGRNPSMTWVLPDPEKRISGEHLRVFFQDGAYWMQDVSKNGTLINGLPMEGMRRVLHNDQLIIGHYRIKVEVTDPPAAVAFVTTISAAPETVWPPVQASAPYKSAAPGFDAAADGFGTHWSPHKATPRPDPGTALLAAITRGAGLPPDSLTGQDVEKLGEEIGGCLRVVAEQMIDLLALRANAKKTQRSQNRTMMAPQGNNPLKASANAEAALMQFFVQRVAFFLAAPEALKEGFADIRQHQEASDAAMRSALDQLMADLSPEAIETGVRGGLWQSKASRAWAKYARDWDAKVKTQENGLMDAFLRYFSAAYDEASPEKPNRPQ